MAGQDIFNQHTSHFATTVFSFKLVTAVKLPIQNHLLPFIELRSILLISYRLALMTSTISEMGDVVFPPMEART